MPPNFTRLATLCTHKLIRYVFIVHIHMPHCCSAKHISIALRVSSKFGQFYPYYIYIISVVKWLLSTKICYIYLIWIHQSNTYVGIQNRVRSKNLKRYVCIFMLKRRKKTLNNTQPKRNTCVRYLNIV